MRWHLPRRDQLRSVRHDVISAAFELAVCEDNTSLTCRLDVGVVVKAE